MLICVFSQMQPQTAWNSPTGRFSYTEFNTSSHIILNAHWYHMQIDELQQACVAHINAHLDRREHELGTANYYY